MPVCISILRGINVSGQKKIRMADLKTLYEQQGFTYVTTYIQSGNVIFNALSSDTNTLAQQISEAIEAAYGFTVPVIVLSKTAWEEAVKSNPFLGEPGIEQDKLHLTFLKDTPETSALQKLETVDYAPDTYQIIGKNIFLYCPNGYGRTKLNNNFFEQKLKVTATTRSWKTVLKLQEMAGGT